MTSTVRFARAILFAFLTVTGACGKGGIEWGEVSYVRASEKTEEPKLADAIPRGCRTSIRSALIPGGEIAVWWEIRQDSSAILHAARRNATTWGPPMTIDSLDRGRRGCDRPAPAIAADSTTRSVHIAYFLEPEDGAGVFFAHSMDDGGLFHAPVSIVYGRRPAVVSVAARKEKVAVAYEEPNAARPQVHVALSASMGHIFEKRIGLSGANVQATRPRVNFRGERIEVSWVEPGATTEAPVRRATRAGDWK